MDFTIPILKELNNQIDGGLITPLDCLKVLNRIQSERLDLREKCEAILRAERGKEAERRMEMYQENREWYELRSKLLQCWRDARTNTNRDVKEQINFLPDKDLVYIDSEKLDRLDIQNKDIKTVYQALEDLIKIPKK